MKEKVSEAACQRKPISTVVIKSTVGRALWPTPIIPALWGQEFETSLANTVKPCLYQKYKS